MSSHWTNYGRDLFVDAFNKRADLLASCSNTLRYARATPQHGEIFAGWIHAAIDTLDQSRRALGIDFGGEDGFLNDSKNEIILRMSLSAQSGPDALGGDLAKIVGGLRCCVTKSKGALMVSFPEAAESATPATEPIEVKIVSMPERVTTTDIERDGTGNIIASTQVEKDATA